MSMGAIRRFLAACATLAAACAVPAAAAPQNLDEYQKWEKLYLELFGGSKK